MPIRAWRDNFKIQRGSISGYAKLVGGSAGRLVISLAYFVSVANTLSVAEFGLFATASAIGVVLSRVFGLGFVSPLYRTATRKTRLVGTYTAGYILAALASAPLVALLAALFFATLFRDEMALGAFAAVMAAEILFWRTLEIVCIVNNGMRRFGRGAAVVILGSTLRAAAAVLFAIGTDGSLSSWAGYYLLANLLGAALAVLFFYPRQRLRVRLRLYAARWRDSVSVAAAEVSFYLQSELDKLLVLALGGPYVAGIYAILMRLIDLTALPIRSANTLIVQKLMVEADWLRTWSRRWTVEFAVAAVSIAGLAAIGLLLHLYPRLLGDNVADAAPVVLLALLVPAFRNLIEYESELLYARGKTGVRVLILVLLGGIKAGLIALLFTNDGSSTGWILGLNGVYATLWLVSVTTSYTAFDWERRHTPPFFTRGAQPSG